jgi:hypothetical protein
MTCGIYKITNLITGQCYIGLSIHIEQRWKEHQNGHGSKQLYKDFWEYGIKNFSFEILEECPPEQLDNREIYWIQQYNSYKDGYNKTQGGETVEHIVEATKKPVYCYDLEGNFICEYESLAEAERLTGIPNSNISKAVRGIDRLVAGKYQWRDIKTDHIEPYKRTCRFKEPPKHNMKKVLQIDKNTDEIIAEFESITEAAKQTGTNQNCIGMVCNGQRKTSNGYKWKFKE